MYIPTEWKVNQISIYYNKNVYNFRAVALPECWGYKLKTYLPVFHQREKCKNDSLYLMYILLKKGNFYLDSS